MVRVLEMGEGMRRRDPDDDYVEPPRLRQLRWLVNTLLVVLILGVLTITAVVVLRLRPVADAPALPDELALPAGERAEAVTLGRGWVAVVTRDEAGVERIRLFDRATGTARAATEIAPAE